MKLLYFTGQHCPERSGPMTRMVPLKKQSKRAQKKYHSSQRGTWHGLCPVTRTVPSAKVYDRKKRKQEGEGD